MTTTFETDPRGHALEIVEQGLVSADHLLLCALKHMNYDDVREMLDANELSPRFEEKEEEEEEEEFELDDEDDVRDAFWTESGYAELLCALKCMSKDYNATIRTSFIDWLDNAHRAGRLSDGLAGEVTL